MLSRAFRQSALLCAAAAEARCRTSVQSLKTAYFLTMKFSAAATFREEGPGRPDGGAHPLARGVGALLRLLYAVPVRLVRLVMRRMVLALRHSGWWLLRLGRAEPTSDVCRPSQGRVLSAPCRAFNVSYAVVNASDAAAHMSRADIANRMRRLPGWKGPHPLVDWLLAVPGPRTPQRGRASARQCNWSSAGASYELLRLGLTYGTTVRPRRSGPHAACPAAAARSRPLQHACRCHMASRCLRFS